MKHTLNIWVIGGDLRQSKLAELLHSDGHTVHTYALEHTPDPLWEGESTLAGLDLADCVVLPLPVTGDGTMLNAPLSKRSHPLVQVLDALRPGQILCAGRVDQRTLAMAQERGLILHDYFAREELAVANAVPTALAIGHRKRQRNIRCRQFTKDPLQRPALERFFWQKGVYALQTWWGIVFIGMPLSRSTSVCAVMVS